MGINFRKFFCQAANKGTWLYDVCDCQRYEVEFEICSSSSLRANRWCPEPIKRRFKPGTEPKETCKEHVAPPPPPRFKVCSDSGRLATPWCQNTFGSDDSPALACRLCAPEKQAGRPWLICGTEGLAFDAGGRSDEEIGRYARRLGEAGVDLVRVFAWGGPGYIDPFPRTAPGSFEISIARPQFIAQLQRVQRILGLWGVGLLFDSFDNCGSGQDWDPWTHNANGVSSYRDTSPQALELFKNWIRQVAQAVGIEGNLFGLGNELCCPGEPDVAAAHAWADAWAVPLANFLKDECAVRMPVSFSGYEATAHKIYNHLSETGPWPWADVCEHLHGLGLPEHWRDFYYDRVSGRKYYCVSDDGVDQALWNKVPVDKRGPCSRSGYCTSHWPYRIEMVREARAQLEDRLVAVEFMPRELKEADISLDNLDQAESVDVWWHLAIDLYGIDPRRSF